MQFRKGMPLIAAALALSVSLVTVPAAASTSSSAAAADPGTVGVTAGTGSFRVAGTDTQFLPRGFASISVLLPGPYAEQYCAGDPPSTVAEVEGIEQNMERNADRELLAMKTHWRANTVRFQVSQIGLSYEHQNHLSAYTDLVRHVIRQARAMGLVTIVSLQTEQWSCTPRRPNGKLVRIPDQNSVDAWKQVAPEFGHDRGVVLELFNEPSTPAECGTASWTQWDYGCSDGSGIGMVNLGNAVRAMAPDNVLVFDGDPSAKSFQGFTPPADMPGNSAYAIHPYLYWQGDWDELYGDFQASGHTVIVTEWNESSSCTDPQMLAGDFVQNYLPSHHIGLLVQAWDAPWNQLVDANDDPADANQACASFTGASLADNQFWSEAGNGDPAPEVHVSDLTMDHNGSDSSLEAVTLALADNGTRDCTTGPQIARSVQILVRDRRTHQVKPLTVTQLARSSPWTCGSYTMATASDLEHRPATAHAGDTLIFRVYYQGIAGHDDVDYHVGAPAS